ncbi:MAG: HEAT repeat domain-containing protein [Planctomycetota bacterium]|jgi:HEAT repeat protein
MRVVAVLLLITCAAVAQDMKGLVEKLNSSDWRKRREAHAALVKLDGRWVIHQLLSASPGFRYEGQLYAIYVLREFPDGDSRPAYRKLLKAKSPFLRIAAAVELSRMGEEQETGVIVWALKAEGTDATFAEGMLEYLRRLEGGWPPVLRETLRSLLDPGVHQRLASEAIYLLHEKVRDYDALPACRTLLKDPRGGIRALAAAYLYRFTDSEGAAELAAALRTGGIHYDESGRIHNLLEEMTNLDDRVGEALIERLGKEESSFVLEDWIQILQHFGCAEAIPAIRRLRDHRAERVSKAAAEAVTQITLRADERALARMTRERDVAALGKWLAGPEPRRRLDAANALRRMDDHSGLPAVVGVLRGKSDKSEEAARMLGLFRSGAAVEPLIDALVDVREPVRVKAEESLGAVLAALFPYRGLDFGTAGYASDAPPDERRAAAERIRAWWRANRESDW